MKKNYKSVWNPSAKTWVAVSETSRSKNKKNQTTRSLKKFGQSVIFNALVGLASFIVMPARANVCDNSLSGAVTFEMTSGDDSVICSQGDFFNINGLGGNDYLYFSNLDGDLNINGNIQFENGSDILNFTKRSNDFQFNISGINSINMGDGNDEVYIVNNTNNNFNFSSNVNLGDGNDLLIINGEVTLSGDIHGGEGNDNISFNSSIQDNKTIINGSLFTEAGDDTLELTSVSISGSVLLGDGSDRLFLNNSIINGEINSGDGNDEVYINESIIKESIFTGSGNDILIIDNSSYNGIFTGDDNDEITIVDSKNFNNDAVIDGGSGDDSLILGSKLPITLTAENLKNLEHLRIDSNVSLIFKGKELQFTDADNNQYQSFFIDGFSVFSFTENNFIINFKNNNGVLINKYATINLRGNNVGRTLTIKGDYEGVGDAIILFNTQLGNDSSKSDKLLINGHSVGKSLVFVKNKGGTGGQTVSGIQLIEVKGDSSAVFKLGAPLQVGGYEYFLVKRNKDWYLVSEINSINPDNTDTDPLNPLDSNKKPNSLQNKIYRPAVAGYLQASQAQFDQNTSLISNAYQRQNANTKVDGNWARAVTDKSSLKTNTFGYAQTQQVFQFGKDLWSQNTQVGGQKHINLAGATFAIGQQTADYTDKQRGFTQSGYSTGSSDSKIYGLGGYYYIQGQNNQYLDIQGQVTASNTSFSDVNQVSARQKGLGVATSIEMGQNNAYSLAGLDITPQAQVIYQNIKSSGFKDSVSDVSKQTAESLRLRLGVQIKSLQKVNSDQTSSLSWNATVNLWQEIFDGPTRTVAGTLAQTHSSNNTWAEMGFGFKHKISDLSEWGANLSHHQSLNNNQKTGNSVHLTYRMKW